MFKVALDISKKRQLEYEANAEIQNLPLPLFSCCLDFAVGKAIDNTKCFHIF